MNKATPLPTTKPSRKSTMRVAEAPEIEGDTDAPVTDEQLAAITFALASPSWRRHPADIGSWVNNAISEFPTWGLVELVLRDGDVASAEKVRQDPDAFVTVLEAIGTLQDRWDAGAEVLSVSRGRLLAVLTRVELEARA